MGYTKPFLKWAGGKYRLLHVILQALPTQGRLVEPFGGSGAVFLNAANPCYLIAEKNVHLVQLYQQIKQEGAAFIQYCQRLFRPQTNQAAFYYQTRRDFNQLSDAREKAALFLYLNRHGYNGLCRYNRSGGFNVPFGRYKQPYFPAREMLHFYEKSQNTEFVHQDFRKTFENLLPDDVVYCDPPYVSLSPSASFSTYTGEKFTQQDQLALAHLARQAQQAGHYVMISNHDTSLTREYYKQSEIQAFEVRRYISCQAKSGRLLVPELLALFKP